MLSALADVEPARVFEDEEKETGVRRESMLVLVEGVSTSALVRLSDPVLEELRVPSPFVPLSMRWPAKCAEKTVDTGRRRKEGKFVCPGGALRGASS